MKKKTILALILCLALVSSVCTGCGSSNSPAADSSADAEAATVEENIGGDAEEASLTTVEKKTPEGTYIYGVNAEPNSLDPIASFGDSHYEYDAVYDTLFDYDDQTGEYTPSLATDWEWEDDLTLTIHLRDDVYFHGGQHMTTEDVLFSIQRFSTSMFHSGYVAYIDFDNCIIEDDYTLTLKLTDTFVPLMNFLASPFGSILCKSWVEEVGDAALETDMNGTGPFILDEWIMGDSISFVKNENYWGEEPGYDKLIIRFIAEDTTRFIAFENGELDAIGNLSGADIDRLANGEVEGAELYAVDATTINYLILNSHNEALSDLRVREAIAHAIDMEALVETVFGSSAKTSSGFLPDTVLGAADIGIYEYDPELSRELLEEAGYGDGLTLIGMCSQDTTDTQILEVVQYYLGEVGITMSVDVVDASVQVMAQISGDMDIGKGASVATAGDTFELFSSTKDSSNLVAGTDDQTLLDMINAAELETDADARAELYTEIQQYMYDNVICIPICQRIWGMACWNYVDNFNAPISGIHDPSTVTFK